MESTKNVAVAFFIIITSAIGALVGMFVATGGGIDSGKWACAPAVTYLLQNASIILSIAFAAIALYLLSKRGQRPVFPYVLATIGYAILLTVVINFGTNSCS